MRIRARSRTSGPGVDRTRREWVPRAHQAAQLGGGHWRQRFGRTAPHPGRQLGRQVGARRVAAEVDRRQPGRPRQSVGVSPTSTRTRRSVSGRSAGSARTSAAVASGARVKTAAPSPTWTGGSCCRRPSAVAVLTGGYDGCGERSRERAWSTRGAVRARQASYTSSAEPPARMRPRGSATRSRMLSRIWSNSAEPARQPAEPGEARVAGDVGRKSTSRPRLVAGR